MCLICVYAHVFICVFIYTMLYIYIYIILYYARDDELKLTVKMDELNTQKTFLMDR